MVAKSITASPARTLARKENTRKPPSIIYYKTPGAEGTTEIVKGSRRVPVLIGDSVCSYLTNNTGEVVAMTNNTVVFRTSGGVEESALWSEVSLNHLGPGAAAQCEATNVERLLLMARRLREIKVEFEAMDLPAEAPAIETSADDLVKSLQDVQNALSEVTVEIITQTDAPLLSTR
jgi:hypothetical protein